ncbi:DUF1552 domain-containing protein [Planctomicrobium piriforme]|uniref:Tat (Twin-arginine translocation) pathway signal sequence n=1 Tax=Planctomicrobium piriforme TaxID=1576369 RepID=A0A1I3CAL3_9PLAN|nr:DUF1552 domain-containing protein [Planctomicrobium piriforme]SFH71356.1 Protein of unknown function [Planctomicrobium piriforme]
MKNTWNISRRHFLRGAGVALSLPWLQSVLPRTAWADTAVARPPVRFGCLFFPNGVWQPDWIPEKAGGEFTLPSSLEPLANVKDKLVVISNLDKKHSHDGDGHYAKTANFLTGLHVEKTTGKNISTGGISLDQLMAQQTGRFTPLPSLELGIDPVISGIDSNVGYTRLYGSSISWQTANRPVAKEINPRLVYERLFGIRQSGRQQSGTSATYDDRQQLLDLAMDDARGLRKKLGRDDQFKLDEYLDSVRAVERQIEFFHQPDPREWTSSVPETAFTAPAPGIPGDYQLHVKLMLELMVLAFWSDSTRVSTFMFANDVSGRNFSFVDGVKGAHHELSHHEDKAEKIEQYKRINRWHSQQFAHMLEKMRGIQEGQGNLLEHSMILMGCGMSDGNRHDPNNLPILVGGGGNGTLKTGQHIACDKGTPLCNLYLSMLQQMGSPADSFGDSTGPLAGLT